MKYKYSDYCTCFYCPNEKEVWVWDEIKDRRIQTIKVSSESEAKDIISKWIEGAPKNRICEVI